MTYEYKIIQIPPNIEVQSNEQQGQARARFLEAMLNEQIKDGWEFYRIDNMGGVVNPGCLGSLMGQKQAHEIFCVVSFRKKLETELAASARSETEVQLAVTQALLAEFMAEGKQINEGGGIDKKRLHELAKEMSLTSAELIQKITEWKLLPRRVKLVASSRLDDSLVENIMRCFKSIENDPTLPTNE